MKISALVLSACLLGSHYETVQAAIVGFTPHGAPCSDKELQALESISKHCVSEAFGTPNVEESDGWQVVIGGDSHRKLSACGEDFCYVMCQTQGTYCYCCPGSCPCGQDRRLEEGRDSADTLEKIRECATQAVLLQDVTCVEGEGVGVSIDDHMGLVNIEMVLGTVEDELGH